MADFLQQLYSALGGMQQPPTQPGVGGQQQPVVPAAQPGVMDFLSSPVAQGALGAYLGYLSRPRGLNTSPWQGVGLGGLAGLQAMQGARAQQLALPLQTAQTREAIAKAGLTESEAQFYQKNPTAAGYHFAPEYEKGVVATAANKKVAQDVRAQAMTVADSGMRQRMLSAADIIEAAPEFYDPDKVTKLIQDPTLEGRVKESEIQKNIATTALLQKGGKPELLETPEGPIWAYPGGPLPKQPVTKVGGPPTAGSMKHWIKRDAAGNIVDEQFLPPGAPNPSGPGWETLDVLKETRMGRAEASSEAARAEHAREFEFTAGKWKAGANQVSRNLPDGTVITVPVDKGGFGAWLSKSTGTEAPAQVVSPDGTVRQMTPDQLQSYLGPIQQAMDELPSGWRIDRLNPDGSVHAVDPKGAGHTYKPAAATAGP